jgi:hypothetical protein
LKELVATWSFKQESFSSLDENDKKPVQISRLEGACFLFREQAHDTDIKSEPPLEDCKPILKELVAVAPGTPEEGRALAEVSCSLVRNINAYRLCNMYFYVPTIS